ncbi:hypothetical protein F511_28064 [Dorcoceras hygrometricum]|uniref:Uncharacterized protein n=1 Tax=Dorcoceras hygrometricum TaxID=472368 RepID=A0A2Z7AJB1_9LAMI|nr:hypothetical protein F511_28064 [Dorcoceras hygrometricum]
MRRRFGDATVNVMRHRFSDSYLASGMMCPRSERSSVRRHLDEFQICFGVESRSGVALRSELGTTLGLKFSVATVPQISTGSSDRIKSGSAGLLLSRPFFLYLFRRLGVSSKRIAKVATLCSLLAFEQIYFSVQVSDLSARDLVVVIVDQKVKDSCIEDVRQYHAPHLPAGLLIAAMSRVVSSHVT